MIDWVKFQEAGEWVIFPLDTINHMSRTHALWLFADKSPGPFHIPVVAKCGDQYISNDHETRQNYHRSRLKITKFSELQPSDKMLASVGLLGGA